MQTLAIDIETYSSADLSDSGVYKYCEAADFEILLFAYSLNGAPAEVVCLRNSGLPMVVLHALSNPDVIKTAWNAAFERPCLAAHFKRKMPANQWQCTMVKAAMLGLPLGLDAAAKVLQLEQQKDAAGKALIKYFSMPCKPSKVNDGRTRNLPIHNPEKWEAFKDYCKKDVEVEQAIFNKLSFFEIPETEKRLYNLDQKINDTGVLLDREFVLSAIKLDEINKKKLNAEALELTNLDNPNSPAQLKDWLSNETDTVVTSLKKSDIPVMLAKSHGATVDRVLNIRSEMAKTSVKKYYAMLAAMGADDRLRGIFQFYGANRTGRWAGRIVQPQNLPQNHLPDLDLARQVVREGDIDTVELLYGNVPDTLSQLIRTAFIAAPGKTLLVADFSAIEARIIAWLAGEKWRLDVFATHGKIYEASAAQMFKVPIEAVTKGSALRQKGKVSELALGYQGGPNALITMGALNMGIAESELPALVKMWRNANPAIVKLWYTVQDAALKCVIENRAVQIMYGLRFFMEKGILFIELPSKRRLAYLRPKIVDGDYGDALTYEGLDQTTKQWRRMDTYGGKLVENIVQAIARDCLAEAMLRVDTAGYNIVMHVHDEIVAEEFDCEHDQSLSEILKVMSEPIPWAPGLRLTAEGYETVYYKKD